MKARKTVPDRDEVSGLFADAYKKGGQDKERDVAKVRALNNNKDVQRSKAFTRPKGSRSDEACGITIRGEAGV
jgi:hypothetical protein